MRTIQILTIVLLFAATVTTSCKKEEPEPEPVDTTTTTTPDPMAFDDLSAENSTIATGATTKVTATASGTNLTYSWELMSGSLGDILGSGSQITYTASPCCTGNNTLKCTVSDGTDTESKTIAVTVQ